MFDPEATHSHLKYSREHQDLLLSECISLIPTYKQDLLKLDNLRHFYHFNKTNMYYSNVTNLQNISRWLVVCQSLTKDFEFMSELIYLVHLNMNLLPLKDIAPACMVMLQHPDLAFRSKFRKKLADKLLSLDLNSVELDINGAVSILKALRNVISDFKVWLCVDFLVLKAMKNKDINFKLNKDDLMDVINTLAFKEVQNIDTWQELSSTYVEYMMQDKLELHDIVSGVISFKSVSIKAPELYDMIVNYFAYKEYSVADLEKYNNHSRVIKFFNSVASMYGR